MSKQVNLSDSAMARMNVNRCLGESLSDIVIRVLPEHPSKKQLIIKRWNEFRDQAYFFGVGGNVLDKMQEVLVANLGEQKRLAATAQENEDSKGVIPLHEGRDDGAPNAKGGGF